jgi:hypothetical protein
MKDNFKDSSAREHQSISLKNNGHSNSSSNNSNIILNQNGVPCYNNINIYTSGLNSIKTNDINLRQYIFNKVHNKKSNGLKLNNKSLQHGRSNSTAGN